MMPGPRSATLTRPSGLVLTNTSDHAGECRTAFSTRFLMASPIACRFPLTSTGSRDPLKAIVRSLDNAHGAMVATMLLAASLRSATPVTSNTIASPQQLLDKSIHTRHVALDFFERGRDDCQRRP